MFGCGFGFVLNQPFRVSTGGGGGGTTYTPDRVELIQTLAFNPGDIVITLPHAPINDAAVMVYYNNDKILPGAGGFTRSGADITLDFDDDPTQYDTKNVLIEVYYWYSS